MQQLSDHEKILTHVFKPLYHINQKIKVYDLKKLLDGGRKILFKPHRINFFAIVLVLQGQGKHIIDFQEISIKTGDILLIFPGQIHQYTVPENLKCMVLAFEEDIFINNKSTISLKDSYSILDELILKNFISVSESVMQILGGIAAAIELETRHQLDQNQTPLLQSMLSIILYTIHREMYINESNDAGFHDKRIALSFKKLVCDSLNVQNTVDFYLKKLNISKATLLKATRSTFDRSPKSLIQDILIMEAKRLLSQANKQIKDVAYDLGFTEPTNFTKFFKKNTFLTPEAFRENVFRM